MGRENIPGYPNNPHIRVARRDNKWKAEAYYHPSIASTGWSQKDLAPKDIPVLGDYMLHLTLRVR